MAREAKVTRTIQTTTVNVLCLNIEKSEPFEQTLTLSGVFKDDKTILKHVEKLINNETVKAVHITSATVNETLYGMSEQRFIELAEVLPPRKNNKTDNN